MAEEPDATTEVAGEKVDNATDNELTASVEGLDVIATFHATAIP
ncbi:MAG: hypothetical protein R3F24_10755 [Gammaproteobacteria bacterium]